MAGAPRGPLQQRGSGRSGTGTAPLQRAGAATPVPARRQLLAATVAATTLAGLGGAARPAAAGNAGEAVKLRKKVRFAIGWGKGWNKVSAETVPRLRGRRDGDAGLTGRNAAAVSLWMATQTWDGVARDDACNYGAEGAECREARIAAGLKADMDAVASTAGSKKVKTSQGAVSQLDDKYAVATRELVEDIRQYAALEPFDKTRVQAQAELQEEAKNWSAAYAPGGSARTESSRKIYNAVDALLGHFAFNGLAPMAPPKMQAVLANTTTGLELLAKGS